MLKPLISARVFHFITGFLFIAFLFVNHRVSAQVAIQSYDSKTGTSATTHSLSSVPAGALLVLTTSCERDGTTCSVSSSPSLTWAKKVDASAVNSGDAEIYTAVFTAGGSISVTSNWGNESQVSVCYVVTGQETTLGGATAVATGQSAPSVNITTTRANSILFCVTSDWQAADGSTRTYRNNPDAVNPSENKYYRDPNAFTTYHYSKTAATVTTYTMGLSVPTGQSSGTAVLEIRGLVDTDPPSSPTLSSPSQTATQIDLSWTAATDNVGVTGYDIYVGGNLQGNTTNTTYSVTGLTPATQYSIYVRAKDAAGNGTNSNTITPSTAADTDPPSSFTLSSPSQTATQIDLSWTAATDNIGVTGYDVYVGGNLQGNTTNTTYSVTGLTPGTQYSIYVKAKDAAGNGTNSNTITPSTAADTDPPSSPTLSSPSQTATQIDLSWTAATDNIGVTGYDVYVGGNVQGNTTNTTYSVTGLTPGTQYSIYVKAKDAAGNGTNSNTITPSTLSGIDYWSLTGNDGTNASGTPAINFVGTTDAQPLVFKANNIERMRFKLNEPIVIPYNNASGYMLEISHAGYGTGGIHINSNNPDLHTYLSAGTLHIANGLLGIVAEAEGRISPGNNDIYFTGYNNLENLRSQKYGGVVVNNNSGTSPFFKVKGSTDPNLIVTNSTSNTVGIGVANPTAKFHTNGTLRFESLSNNDALTRILATDASGNVSWRDAATLGAGVSSLWTDGGSGDIYNTSSGLVTIATSANPDPTDANLKLAVNGNIYAKKVKVAQTGWPDYVFHHQYKLPSLREIEEFIQKYKHLPDVPSAAEVEKDGLSLGDNQAVLLKKIEELTLYLIEINKKVEKLSEENEELKKKLENGNE